jgi:hypothetical protein
MTELEKLAEEFAHRHPQITGNEIDCVRIPFHRNEAYLAGFRKAREMSEKAAYSVSEKGDACIDCGELISAEIKKLGEEEVKG